MPTLPGKVSTDTKLIERLAASPDINPIENFLLIIKRNIYENGKQYSSKENCWKATETAKSNIRAETVENPTISVDERIIRVI